MTTDLSTLAAAAFEPLIGQTFTFTAGPDDPVLILTLREVKEMPHATMRAAPRTAFTLLLDAQGPSPVSDGIVLLDHPDLGRIGPLRLNQIVNPTYGSNDAMFQINFN